MISLRRSAAAALVALLAVACGGEGAAPSPTPTDTLSAAQRRLAELSKLAATATYDVTYDLAAAAGEKGTIRIVAAPPSFRVDVTLGAEPSTFIQREGTVVSCTTKSGKASCFLVARPGEPVPELFDPGVQRLFADAVSELAANPQAFDVASISAPPSTPPGECFDVRRLAASSSGATAGAAPTADPTGFETGQYCFGSDGVLTRLSVSTGTLTLRTRGPAPTATAFEPPASPVALPDLPDLPSASPTP